MTASAGDRVLMLVENNPYPEDGRVRREATSLVEAGYDVTVIAPADDGQRRHEMVDGVRVYRYPAPPEGDGLWGYAAEYGYSMAAALVLSLLVFVRHGFDVVHVHNPPDTFFLIGGLYRMLGRTFVFDHHDLSPDMYDARFGADANPLIHRLLRWIERRCLRTADHVIATNDSYAREARERGDVAPHRVTVVRNGPDLQRVRAMPLDPELRGRAPTIIGYVGLMNHQDGVDYLLRALSHLLLERKRADFFAVLVGRGDALSELQAEASRLGLGQHVMFTGRISDEELMTVLSTADICVDPDPSNPFNDRSTMIKMTEYMALGKPIVAFDLPEHRVTAGEAAVYAAANDEADFARCLESLMDDEMRRKEMGELGRHRIETELAWPRQAERLVALYADLTGG